MGEVLLIAITNTLKKNGSTDKSLSAPPFFYLVAIYVKYK